MRVQHSSYPAIDIPEGAWPVYKAQGYHQVVNPEMLAPEVEVRWSTQRGRFIGDYECPPIIIFNATNGTKGFVESATGTAHKTAKVFVPGQRPHTCPTDVAARYLELFQEWAAKSKKKNGEIKQPPVERFDTNFASTPKVPGVSPYAGATHQPWAQDVELRNK